MNLLKVFKLLFLLQLLTFMACSKKSGNTREHVNNEVKTAAEVDVLSSSHIDVGNRLEALLKSSKIDEALKLILSDESIKNSEFTSSALVLDNFQKILDIELKNKTSRNLLINSYNKLCTHKVSVCGFSRLLELDNRLVSLLISNFDNLTNKREFFKYLFSIDYKGEDKWLLLAHEINKSSAPHKYKSIFIETVQLQKESFKSFKNIDALVLKVFPKIDSSWYDYIISLRAIGVTTDQLESSLIKMANKEQKKKICGGFKVKILTLKRTDLINCDVKTKLSLELILNQDIMITAFPSRIMPEHRVNSKTVKDFLLQKAYSLMESTLVDMNEYYNSQVNNNRVNGKFLSNMREFTINKISPEWSGFIDDVNKTAEILFINDGDVKVRRLSRQLVNYFTIAMEVPFNLILNSKLMDLGHTEVIDFELTQVVFNASTVGKELFSGKMDQIIRFIPNSEISILDPLKIAWGSRAIKDLSIHKIFNFKFKESFLNLFNQSINNDYKEFDSLYQAYLRRRTKMTPFFKQCSDLKNNNFSFLFNFDELVGGDTAYRLAVGSVGVPAVGGVTDTFSSAYLTTPPKHFLPEMFEIFRSDVYPKILLRNGALGNDVDLHPIEVKVAELKKNTLSDMKIFEDCIFKMKSIESKVAAHILSKEIEFSSEVKEELERLNSGAKGLAYSLDKFTNQVKNKPLWSEFFEDFPVKYGFIKDGARYFFSDGGALRSLRIAHYLKSSPMASVYNYKYGSYLNIVKNLEKGNASDIYNSYMDSEKFFVSRFEKMFGLLKSRHKVIAAVAQLNLIDAAIQKISFNQSKEDSYKVFDKVNSRSKKYVLNFSLQDWERRLLLSVDRVCPSCGSQAKDTLAGPEGLLASEVAYGQSVDKSFTWGPVDSYFNLMNSKDLGRRPNLSNYLPLPHTISFREPKNNEDGRGQGTVVARNFFNREGPWVAIDRITDSYEASKWDLFLEFGDDALDQVSVIVKHDMMMMMRLISYDLEKSKEAELLEYDFSTVYGKIESKKLISDHLINSYKNDLEDFHRKSFGLYK